MVTSGASSSRSTACLFAPGTTGQFSTATLQRPRAPQKWGSWVSAQSISLGDAGFKADFGLPGEALKPFRGPLVKQGRWPRRNKLFVTSAS
jgi:hypothetical protein